MAKGNVVDSYALYNAASVGKRVVDRKGEALDNISKGVGKIAGIVMAKNKRLNALKAEFPEGIKREFINENVRSGLTEYVTSEKDTYNANIKTMKRFPSFSKKYKQAVEDNNKIKSGMAKVNEDLMYVFNAGTKAEGMRLADGTLPELEDDHLDLATGDIWDRGYEFSRDGVGIGDMATAQESMGENMYKPITDVKVGQARSTTGSDQYNALSKEILNYGINGGELDDGMNKYYKNKLNGMLDGLSENELRHFYFNGMSDDNTNESSAAYSKLLSMGFERVDVPDEDLDPQGYASAIENNERYNIELNKLKYSNNLSTPELKNQLMNTLADVHTTGQNQYKTKQAKIDKQNKSKEQVTQKSFYTKIPQALKGEYTDEEGKPVKEIEIQIGEIKTRKDKFDNKASFQGQFYFYAYDPTMKRYLQFKNREEYQASVSDGVMKGGQPISNSMLTEQERLDETGVTTLNFG